MLKEKVLLREGQPVSITPKTFQLLLTLVERQGHLVEKAELMKAVWMDRRLITSPCVIRFRIYGSRKYQTNMKRFQISINHLIKLLIFILLSAAGQLAQETGGIKNTAGVVEYFGKLDS